MLTNQAAFTVDPKQAAMEWYDGDEIIWDPREGHLTIDRPFDGAIPWDDKTHERKVDLRNQAEFYSYCSMLMRESDRMRVARCSQMPDGRWLCVLEEIP